MSAIYPNCVDWSYNHMCHGCDMTIQVGTEHVQVVDTDKPHSHLPHEMPLTRFHPRCAPLTTGQGEATEALT